MISRSEAFSLLKSKVEDEQKLSHAIRVAEMMESMARQFHLQPEKWYLTGLLHDIDIPYIGGDWRRHGIAAQKMLAGVLPAQARMAIKTHDRNTGLKPASKLAHALVLADVVENLSRLAPMEEIRGAMQGGDFEQLKARLPNDAYGLQVMADFARKWPGIKV